MNEEKLYQSWKLNQKNIVKKIVKRADFKYHMKEKVDTNKGKT